MKVEGMAETSSPSVSKVSPWVMAYRWLSTGSLVIVAYWAAMALLPQPQGAQQQPTMEPPLLRKLQTANGYDQRRYLQDMNATSVQRSGNETDEGGRRYYRRYLQDMNVTSVQRSGNETDGGGRRYYRRYLQDMNATMVQRSGNETDGDGRRFLQETNGTRRFLQEGNGTRRYHRYLQEGADNVTARSDPLSIDEVEEDLGNETRRVLAENFELLEFTGPSPCRKVDHGMPQNSWEWDLRCQSFLDLPYVEKDCSVHQEKVPRIYHSVSKTSAQTFHQQGIAKINPSFTRNHLSDEEAATFIRKHCGEDAYEAYHCFAPPAYRADLFRFCALYSQGGIYLDEDIVPFVPLDKLYSPCSTATVGHDFPWQDKAGKQMKILAAAKGAPIFGCALSKIVENVRHRAYPETELQLTGPQMLETCYQQHSEDVAITYHDTRNAEWPFTGMRRGHEILAYELPLSSKHFWMEGGSDNQDYTDLFYSRNVYKETCQLD